MWKQFLISHKIVTFLFCSILLQGVITCLIVAGIYRGQNQQLADDYIFVFSVGVGVYTACLFLPIALLFYSTRRTTRIFMGVFLVIVFIFLFLLRSNFSNTFTFETRHVLASKNIDTTLCDAAGGVLSGHINVVAWRSCIADLYKKNVSTSGYISSLVKGFFTDFYGMPYWLIASPDS